MKKKKIINVLAACCFFTCLCANCSDTNENGSGTPYDASRPVTINSFYPDSGGFATRIIIEGSNFGNNPEEVRVWFNDKQASVIGTNGDHLYAIAPRTPGDECIISVAVGNDSTSISHPFIYRTMTTVTTVTGQKGTNAFNGGTLATATLYYPRYLCVDAENNIYCAQWDNSSSGWPILINEEKDIVMQLPGTKFRAGQPAVDITGTYVLFPEDPGDGYVSYDISMQWASRRRLIIHPTTEEIAAGKEDFSVIRWKQSFTTCQLDGMVYTYDYSGSLIKFDPVSRKGESVGKFAPDTHGLILFHPEEKDLAYIGYTYKSSIYTYNLTTGEYKPFAGTLAVRGYRDGPVEDALFGEIGQMIFDENYDIILTDPDNHCIRKINMKEGIVTTLIGKGGQAGYQDGNAEDALFNRPYGICIDKDYSIYISDTYNNCIRKLAIQ
jgi:hypothetical protein